MTVWTHIEQAIRKRILILDGAMGTMLQSYQLTGADYHGERFKNHATPLKGNNDVLNLTKPDVVRAVHESFLAVGADFIETNTFNATAISQADYDLSPLAPEIAKAGAKIARQAADAWSAKTPHKPRAVLGAVGPLSKTLSLSPKVEDPGYREVDFDQVAAAYEDQITAMFDDIDALLIETIFDTLNAKAAIFAARSVFARKGRDLPLLISGTITDASGRTLSGQTVEAFWISVSHARPFAVGLNCALGAQDMQPYIRALSEIADCHILAYPNAGLPNAFGEYDETPEHMCAHMAPWMASGLVNIIGGCCGSTPDHIRKIATAAETANPHEIRVAAPALRLSGLEPFVLEG